MVRSEAQRLTRLAFFYSAGFVVMMVWVWLFSAPNSVARGVFAGLGIASALLVIVYAPRALWATVMGGPEREALAATKGLMWRHFYRGTGIALDPVQQRLHLLNARAYRSYALSQVRTWTRREQTGGQVYGYGLVVVAANVAAANNNKAASGLFIEVRDVDLPVWRIAFSPGALQRDLPRWMEILQQAVNEGQAAQVDRRV